MNNINRTLKPEEREKLNFNLPDFEEFKLNNGLNVLFIQKNDLPIVQINLMLSAGSKFDPQEMKGLAYLTALMLDEGAGSYNALELDEEFEKLGSVLNISTDHDSTFISLLTLKNNFEKSAKLFSEVITLPHFNETDFKREQLNLLNRITQLSDEPSYIASTAFDKVIFNNSAYAFPTMGLEKNIKQIDIKNLKQYYSRNYSVGGANLVVVGNISRDELKDKFENFLSGWEFTEKIDFSPQDEKREKTIIYLIDRKAAAQSKIRVGHITSPRNDKDFYAKVIANTILGGQFSSRINLNLREDKGYTYGANSSFGYNLSSGYFTVSTAVQSENTAPAIKEIVNELNGIREGIKPEELDFAKSYLIKRFPSMFETYSQMAMNLTTKFLYSLPDNYFNTYIDNIEAASLEDTITAVENNIFPDDLAIVIVGNKNLILPDLEKTFDTNIIELDVTGHQV